eukprot:225101-Chlamydomonas_euryale.AAC.2
MPASTPCSRPGRLLAASRAALLLCAEQPLTPPSFTSPSFTIPVCSSHGAGSAWRGPVGGRAARHGGRSRGHRGARNGRAGHHGWRRRRDAPRATARADRRRHRRGGGRDWKGNC